MRNLKRALSLLLAAAMLIGMMVVGASAAGLDDFSDKDEIVNQDAVSLLTILGVINGKEDGSYFDPAGSVTRAEMAKMIATILNQGADVDGLYAGLNTGLTDVKGHWAESYINYCYSLGIIAGRGNGKFDPTATVTGTEAAKMLLVAAGYDASIEGLTGTDWAIRTAALASTLGIFDNLSAPTGAPLTRDNAALLVYNALDIEMIQSYRDGYAIAYGDNRTILSAKYGVYRLEGVVVGNEWAQLEETDSDAALADGKTRLSDIRLVDSDTVNTRPGVDDGQSRPDTTFNVTTPVEYLGKTVTMYVRNTTVLANSQVLGVYLKDGANTVLTTVDTEDTMRDFLKGTGLSVGSGTEYYVNYGIQDSEADATDAMDFGRDDSHLDNVQGKTNGYGVELTVIDNDQDGIADYVLYLQETLSQVIARNSSKETTTINAFHDNSAIDDEDIVTEADPSEGDLVLVVAYGGRYYVSEPETVTGQMDSYQASKSREQTITVDGTEYHPSYIRYEANTADNTYEFDIQLCDDEGYTEGVQFDTDYDFILDSNGNVIAFQPSEAGLYDFALVLDSGYEPGAFASDASGKVKVLLADGTEATYELDFADSARNIGRQIAANDGADIAYSRNQGIQELKAFLGTADSDNSSTAPWKTMTGSTGVFAQQSTDEDDYLDGQAKGYVIGYSLDGDDELTITSIVGSTEAGEPDIDDYNDGFAADRDANYTAGAGRIRYDGNSKQVAVDRNTIAFYYTNDGDDYGVAVGYDEMTGVTNAPFVAQYVRSTTTLAGVVLFDAVGVQAEKDYVYVLSRNTVTATRAILNVVYMDGTVDEMTIDRDEYDDIFRRDSDFGTAYAYTTNANGISTLTEADGDPQLPVVHGYAWQVNNGTIAVYSDKAGTQRIHLDSDYDNLANLDGYTFSYDEQIWNVEDVSAGDDSAPAGNFSRNVGREVVLVLNADCDQVRAAYIQDVLDGVYSSEFDVAVEAGSDVLAAGGEIAAVTTNPGRLTGTLSYEWFLADNADGDNAVSLKGNDDYSVAADGALSVKGGVLAEGETYYFFAEVTRRESGKVPVTVSSLNNPVAGDRVAAVAVGKSAGTLTFTDNTTYSVYADDSLKALEWQQGRGGSYYVEIPAGARTVTIEDLTNWTDGEHYLYNGRIYTVENKAITLSVTEVGGSIGAFTQHHVLHLADGITVDQDDAVVQGGVTYVADGSTPAITLPAGVSNAIQVTDGDEVTASSAVTTTLNSVSAETWVKGAAQVTLAGTNPAKAYTDDDYATGEVTSTHYVAIGATLYVKAGAAGETVTPTATSGGDVGQLTANGDSSGTNLYTYEMTGVDVTFTSA